MTWWGCHSQDCCNIYNIGYWRNRNNPLSNSPSEGPIYFKLSSFQAYLTQTTRSKVVDPQASLPSDPMDPHVAGILRGGNAPKESFVPRLLVAMRGEHRSTWPKIWPNQRDENSLANTRWKLNKLDAPNYLKHMRGLHWAIYLPAKAVEFLLWTPTGRHGLGRPRCSRICLYPSKIIFSLEAPRWT